MSRDTSEVRVCFLALLSINFPRGEKPCGYRQEMQNTFLFYRLGDAEAGTVSESCAVNKAVPVVKTALIRPDLSDQRGLVL